MSTPKFITFTGLDNLTALKGVFFLSRAYPEKGEWGILYGGTSNRFPGWEVLMKLYGAAPVLGVERDKAMATARAWQELLKKE